MNNGVTGHELWKSDGTAGGTTQVRDIRPGPFGSLFFWPLNDLTAFGNSLVFVADDGVTGLELWKSDGTVLGTTQVRDIPPGS